MCQAVGDRKVDWHGTSSFRLCIEPSVPVCCALHGVPCYQTANGSLFFPPSANQRTACAASSVPSLIFSNCSTPSWAQVPSGAKCEQANVDDVAHTYIHTMAPIHMGYCKKISVKPTNKPPFFNSVNTLHSLVFSLLFSLIFASIIISTVVLLLFSPVAVNLFYLSVPVVWLMYSHAHKKSVNSVDKNIQILIPMVPKHNDCFHI